MAIERVNPSLVEQVTNSRSELKGLRNVALKRIAQKGGRILAWNWNGTETTTTATSFANALVILEPEPAELKAGRTYFIHVPTVGLFSNPPSGNIAAVAVQVTFTVDGSAPEPDSDLMTMTQVPCITGGMVTGTSCGAMWYADTDETMRLQASIWLNAANGATFAGIWDTDGAGYELYLVDVGGETGDIMT